MRSNCQALFSENRAAYFFRQPAPYQRFYRRSLLMPLKDFSAL